MNDEDQQIVLQARIYTKEPLSEYHQQLNRLAGKICLQSPSLLVLVQRGELLKQAQKALKDSGYQYTKGRSKSKVFGEDASTAAPKQPKLSKEFRKTRCLQIEEETKSLSKRISFKEKKG